MEIYYVLKIERFGSKYKLTCRNKNEYRNFVVNKLKEIKKNAGKGSTINT